MPVRGTTAWQHGIAQKKVFNFDAWDPRAIVCAWLDCENPGYELYKLVVHLGVVRGERTMNYVFCSEKCKQHWLDDYYRGHRDAERDRTGS
jgi:hypothetical protein